MIKLIKLISKGDIMDQEIRERIEAAVKAHGFTPRFNALRTSRDKVAIYVYAYAYARGHRTDIYLGSLEALSKKSDDELAQFIVAKTSNGKSEVRQ